MRTQKAARREGFLDETPAAQPTTTDSQPADMPGALAASERRFLDFADLVSDWIWETGPSLRFTFLSSRFEEITGMARDTVLDRTLLDVANAELRDPHWQRHLEDFLAQRPFQNFRFSSALPSGEARHFQVSGRPFFDAQGRFQGYRGTGRDVTESERTHESLHAVKARLEHLLNTSPAMIYSFRAGGNHAATFASNNIKTQLGHEPTEFLDDPGFWTHHIHPDDAPRVFDEMATLFKTGHHVQEYRFRHKDGSYRWMRDELVLVEDNDGTPLEVVGYWVDITDRKRAEESVRDYAGRLERSNRELQDFAYVASHDLQEPLRKIEAFGDRLKVKCGDGLSDDGKLYLDRMQNAAARMRALINSLLSYSRVTSKAQPFAPVDLNDVVSDAVSDLQVRIERSGGKVEVGPMPTVDADPTQMRQLLLNLVGNALKFQKEGVVPLIRVTAELCARDGVSPPPDDPDDIWCKISVADNGIGFEEKYIDRIFSMFQRLHGRNEYEGTGIGLATCRKIVERHGGSITAKSAPDQGATFIALVPTRHANKE
jgi:PAS domain S-box-containing protein